MLGLKTATEEFIGLAPLNRLKRFNLWLIVLLVVGLGALIYIVTQFVQPTPHPISLMPGRPQPPVEIKPYIILGIFVLLALALIVSFIAMFFAKGQKQVERAFEVVKLLMGFFTGIAASYFGQ